jgi:hypothetical protein
MNAHPDHNERRRLMAAAGLLYLVIIACGLYAELGVRTALIVQDDAEATAGRLLASPGLFRSGFVADSLMLFADVAIAVVLYRLLRPVGRTLSLAAAAFRLIQAAILGANLLLYHGALLVLTDGVRGGGLDAAPASRSPTGSTTSSSAVRWSRARPSSAISTSAARWTSSCCRPAWSPPRSRPGWATRSA